VPDQLLSEIEEVYRLRFAHFFRVARAIVRDEELAFDAVQDAFAGAIRGREGFSAGSPLEAWLWRSVVNAALKLRRLPVEQSLAGDETPAAETGLFSVGDVDLGCLSERQKLVLFLRYYADLPERRIGEVLGIERGTVSATLHAALRALRRDLEVAQ
jgi:RNA polymerase sigma-70 factor (ECF subfamily)